MGDELNRMMAIRPRPGQSTASDSVGDRPHGDDDGVAGEGPRPRKKQRRQRPSHSCAGESILQLQRTRKGPGDELTSQYPECRRLKMKCDREG